MSNISIDRFSQLGAVLAQAQPDTQPTGRDISYDRPAREAYAELSSLLDAYKKISSADLVKFLENLNQEQVALVKNELLKTPYMPPDIDKKIQAAYDSIKAGRNPAQIIYPDSSTPVSGLSGLDFKQLGDIRSLSPLDFLKPQTKTAIEKLEAALLLFLYKSGISETSGAIKFNDGQSGAVSISAIRGRSGMASTNLVDADGKLLVTISPGSISTKAAAESVNDRLALIQNATEAVLKATEAIGK